MLGRAFHFLLNRFYRLVAPRHPRGWVDAHAEMLPDGRLRVFTSGMGRFGAPDFEIVDIPDDADIVGSSHGILFGMMELARQSIAAGQSFAPGQSFGGPLESEGQSVAHLGEFRAVPGEADMLRLVDGPGGAPDGFPARLFATHLAARAEGTDRADRREALARLATEVWWQDCAYDAPPDDPDSFDHNQNRQNYYAWEVLGDTLFAMGRVEEGAAAFREAIARCPEWARRVCESARAMEDEKGHPLVDFLAAADPDAILAEAIAARGH